MPTQQDFENFDKYAEYTSSDDWKGICELNGILLDSFGTKKELKVLSSYLEDDEVVFALTSGIMGQTDTSNAFDWGSNTWLVTLTNERFLFLDHAMITKSVDIQSIRHDSVQAVSASQGWMFGKIQVDLGARVITIDNCNKTTVPIIVDLANKWLRLQKKITASQLVGTSKESLMQMEESHSLLHKQIQNQEKIISLLGEIRDIIDHEK